MIRVLFGLAGSVALAGAQVRQGGVYQIQSETLNAGGGTASGGTYSVLQTLPALGGAAAGECSSQQLQEPARDRECPAQQEPRSWVVHARAQEMRWSRGDACT